MILIAALQPEALLNAARKLAGRTGSGRPRQAELRRAISTAYYAVFHELAREAADALVGKANRRTIPVAWSQVYRALNHGRVRSACRSEAFKNGFPDKIRSFGRGFVALQVKRHDADYNPLLPKLSLATVLDDIATAEQIITDFRLATPLDRRAFCVFVMLDLRG
jgi:hypothetical protein